MSPRTILAWTLYGIGHAIYIVFDHWLPWGMCDPIYRAYQACMGWSVDVQGAGPGPWGDVEMGR